MSQSLRRLRLGSKSFGVLLKFSLWRIRSESVEHGKSKTLHYRGNNGYNVIQISKNIEEYDVKASWWMSSRNTILHSYWIPLWKTGSEHLGAGI